MLAKINLLQVFLAGKELLVAKDPAYHQRKKLWSLLMQLCRCHREPPPVDSMTVSSVPKPLQLCAGVTGGSKAAMHQELRTSDSSGHADMCFRAVPQPQEQKHPYAFSRHRSLTQLSKPVL